MLFEPTVTVGRESLPIAIRHGMELWWDGSTPTKRLDQRGGSNGFSRFVNARVEGKMAEVAFSELLYDYFDIDSAVDWRIYGEYTQTDDGDLQYLVTDDGDQVPLAVDMDIKKTKPWNQWLAVREEIYDHIHDDAPVLLSKLRLEEDLDLDQWEDTESWDEIDGDDVFRSRLLDYAERHFPLEVDFDGIAYKEEFTDYFERGDRLYDPDTGSNIGPKLRRDNWGIHCTDLDTRPSAWNRLVSDIVGTRPISWYPLPVMKRRDI
jgi:hypothetical protein